MPTGDFKPALHQAQALIESLSADQRHRSGDALGEAMHYAISGGKAFRAFLVLESCALYDVKQARAQRAALAIECIHAYSLVHDDLPCMDDDDMRRGRPSVHRKWDEATAVLAGDALQTLAFETISHPSMGPHALDLVHLLAKEAGRDGMVGGQVLDIAAETARDPLGLAQITTLQEQKTGALILWSVQVGPVLCGRTSAGLATYAKALGLAFQIADDILDVEGDAQTVGKALGKDEGAGKATFVSLLGLEGAKARAQELVDEACDAVASYGERAHVLKEAAQFVIERDK